MKEETDVNSQISAEQLCQGQEFRAGKERKGSEMTRQNTEGATVKDGASESCKKKERSSRMKSCRDVTKIFPDRVQRARNTEGEGTKEEREADQTRPDRTQRRKKESKSKAVPLF